MGAEASPQQGTGHSRHRSALLCPVGFSTTRAISKTHQKILCRNKELNCKTVVLGCMYLGQRQGRDTEEQEQEQEWGGEKILAPLQHRGSTG